MYNILHCALAHVRTCSRLKKMDHSPQNDVKMLSENCSLIDRYYAVAVRLVMIRQFGISYSCTEIGVLSKFLLNRLFKTISNIH